MSGAACAGDGCTATGGPTKDAAEVFGLKAEQARSQGFALWSAAAGLILAGIGAYKQYQMYEKMGDLAEAQQKAVDSQRERFEKLQDGIILPNLKQARENLWGYGLPFAKSVVADVIECGTAVCNYTRRSTSSSIAAMNASRTMQAARKLARRSTNPRAVGVCCDNDARLASAQAALVVSQMALAERYEDNVALQWDQLYWSKQATSAQLAQRMAEMASNISVGAANNLTSVMSGLNQALSIGNQTISQQQTGLAGQASVFGGLGSLGGLVAGNMLGAREGASMLRGLDNPSPVGSGVGVLSDFSPGFSSRVSAQDLAQPGELF